MTSKTICHRKSSTTQGCNTLYMDFTVKTPVSVNFHLTFSTISSSKESIYQGHTIASLPYPFPSCYSIVELKTSWNKETCIHVALGNFIFFPIWFGIILYINRWFVINERYNFSLLLFMITWFFLFKIKSHFAIYNTPSRFYDYMVSKPMA